MQVEEKEDRGWVRNVAAMWLAVVIAMMGMSLAIPFLPLYLSHDLHVQDDAARLWAGWIGGINFLCAALMAPVWGTLADRFGRKPMALRALIGLAVSVALMAYVHNAYQLFALRMLQGAFGGFVAEAIALVGASVPRSKVGSALGFLQTGVVGGNFIGPLFGGGLADHFGYRLTFTITGCVLFVAMLLIVVLVKEPHRPDLHREHHGVAANVRDLLRIPELRWMVGVVLCSQCAMMLVNPQLSLFVKDLVHDLRQVNRWAGVISAAPAVSGFLMAPLWGRAGDRKGHAGVLGVALFCAAMIVPWGMGVSVLWQLLVIRAATGLFTSALNPSGHSVAAHSVDSSRTAGAFSLLSSAMMFGSCVGPFASGPLATTLGVRPLFGITSILLLAASLASFRVRSVQAERRKQILELIPAPQTG